MLITLTMKKETKNKREHDFDLLILLIMALLGSTYICTSLLYDAVDSDGVTVERLEE